MQTTELTSLATLRLLVGFLGEKDHFAWWQSSFFAVGSNAFLAPVFPRTMLLAQFEGVTRAASLQHDDRIGVGNVYHLFRLPEDVEQGLHRILQETAFRESLAKPMANRELAHSSLRDMAASTSGSVAGPVRVGGLQDVRGASAWNVAAAHYVQAFDQGIQTYPFFSDRQ